ncbi:unnamed protein product [Amoebophrya sp. A25]|nr:unnamed protein product [Amoebophrya sp. A25]|eukprot:GSA25T00025724001.1
MNNPATAGDLDDFFSQQNLGPPPAASGSVQSSVVPPTLGPQAMQGFGSEPAAGGNPFGAVIPDFLKGAKHPVTCCFHLLFKTLCLLVYLFGGYVWTNAVLTYIFCILFLAFDFWTVKNVTGRLLVGLRWWNIIKDGENGEEVNEWVFESLQDETQLDPLDKNVFWLGTYAWALVWTLFLIINVLSLNLSWIVFLVVAEVFAWTNLMAFWKCSKDQKERMQSWVTGAVLQKMTGGTGLDLGRFV